MPFGFGVPELLILLVIVAMLFGVGKLPEVFGSIGKGVREFRKESGLDPEKEGASQAQITQTPAVQNPSQGQAALQAPAAPAQLTAQDATVATPEYAEPKG